MHWVSLPRKAMRKAEKTNVKPLFEKFGIEAEMLQLNV